MIVITRYRIPVEDGAAFRDLAARALDVLVTRPGCARGQLGRSVDDPELWTLTTTWTTVGNYRRALSDYEVKLHAVPLMYRAIDEPTAFEELLTWAPEEGFEETASDRGE